MEIKSCLAAPNGIGQMMLDDGQIFARVPDGPIILCAMWDGTTILNYDGGVFVPSEWLANYFLNECHNSEAHTAITNGIQKLKKIDEETERRQP